MSGMPKPLQSAPNQSPAPPSACDLRLVSSTALYSAVSGASCPLPQALPASNEGWPGSPGLVRRTPSHRPRRSGYLDSSAAVMVPVELASAATSKLPPKARAQIDLVLSMIILHSPNECYGISRDHSGLMLAARMTLPHFSVSSAMSFPKSAAEPPSTVPPMSASRAFILGSARAALNSLLSLPTISA